MGVLVLARRITYALCLEVRMKRLTVLASALALILTVAWYGSARAADPEKLRIVVLPTEVSAAAYYAYDLGYFKDAGIDADISPIANGNAATAAVVAGAADIGFSNTFSLAIAHDKGLPVNILTGSDLHRTTNPSQGFLAVLKASPIKTGKDFNGKTVAVPGLGTATYFALRNYIDKNGGDSSTVKYVEVPIPAIADAIIMGRVDAGSLDASNMYAARSKAALRQVGNTYDSVALKFMAGAWFATPDWIAKHPDLARKFIAVYERVSTWANAHPDDVVKLYAKHSAFTVEDLKLSPRAALEPSTQLDNVQPVIDVALKYGAIKKAFPAEELFNPAVRPAQGAKS
jgi:NitT/TauT family transport system substrate-binding protein